MPLNIKKNEAAVPQVKMPEKSPYIDHLKEDKPVPAVAPAAKGVVNIVTKKFNPEGTELVEEKLDLEEDVTIGAHDPKFGEPIPLYALQNLNVGGKRTLALENYGGKKFETATIHASLTVPCWKATRDQAWEEASDWVSDKLRESVKSATGGK